MTWPMPTPTLALPLASRMPLDFTERHAFHANAVAVRHITGVGRFVAVFRIALRFGTHNSSPEGVNASKVNAAHNS